jgi:predicted O-methyltransferase YrrM
MKVKEMLKDRIARRILPRFLRTVDLKKYFPDWERSGFHILPKAYYSPVPDTSQLPEKLWDSETQLAGIDMRDEQQLYLLNEIFPLYKSEFDEFPKKLGNDLTQYYHDNAFFVGADAVALYSMIRSTQPKKIIEVGSGFSTRLSASAGMKNGGCELICIEPYPDEILKTLPGVNNLIVSGVEKIALDLFSSLKENDILFIDSTHTVKIGSDVNYLFLEILPRLNPGVLVHVHDIFLPRDYPRAWMLEHQMFSNEQYLLQAFMAFNTAFEVVFSSSYMTLRYPEEMKSHLSAYPRWNEGCSFWMRRKKNT